MCRKPYQEEQRAFLFFNWCGQMCLFHLKRCVISPPDRSFRTAGYCCRSQGVAVTLSALYSSIWSSWRHENRLCSFWCIACWHMGQSDSNVIPCKWCSSHLGSSFELFSSAAFSQRDRKWGQRERIVRHWFAVKNSDRRSFQRRSGRSKAVLAESGREGRWYHWALISFTDECEMTSSVVWTHTRRHYTLLYFDPPILTHFLAATG